ncbi:MAG: FG-GAP-like repeat-containing protein [Phycisphaerales bacterium]|nr:FG-GAP-like repeat-containing protein [Phycisphaerales bacterium]
MHVRQSLKCLVLLLGSSSITSAMAETLTVELDGSGDYVSILDAVEAANKGDFIFVGPGTYAEDIIEMPGWPLVLISTDGAATTIIEPIDSLDPIFVCESGNFGTVLIGGFTLTECDVDEDGGALRISSGSRAIVADCIFTGNSTGGSGGGAWVDVDSFAQFNNCRFEGNTAFVHGGGVAHLSPDSVVLERCLFIGNQAGSNGGGAYVGLNGGAYLDGNTPPVIRDSIFLGNNAGVDGGALHVAPTYTNLLDGTAYVDNCTITQNVAPDNGGVAVSTTHLESWSGGVLVRNSIVSGNTGAPALYDFDNGRPRAQPIYFNSCSDTLQATDVFTNTADQPRFRDQLGPDATPGSGDEDLRLMPGSPCIDRGDNTFVSSTLDFAGLPRIVDDPLTPDPIGTPPRVDMGAHEYAPDDFAGLGIAFWADDSSLPTSVLASANWFEGILPEPGVPGFFNDYESGIQYPELNGSAVTGALNFTQGAFILSGVGKTPPSLTLQENTSPSSSLADLNIGPYDNEYLSTLVLSDIHLSCDLLTIGEGILQAPDSSITLSEGLYIESKNAIFSSLGGGALNSAEAEVDTVVTNLGNILPGGPLAIDGNYRQLGNRSDGSPASGNAWFTLSSSDEELIITGSAQLAGGATFYFDVENPPAVGAQFTIVSASGGFEDTTFDFALTSQSSDGRFVVLSYPSGVGGDTAVATVLDAASLIQGSPETQALGVDLRDALLADIDDDGFDDLVLSIDLGVGVDGSVVVLLNQGVTSGTWNGFETFAGAFAITVGRQPRGLDCGYVNVDDAIDVVVACYEDGAIVVLENTLAGPGPLLSLGPELGSDPSLPPTQSSFPVDVWVGNLDGDAQNLSDILVSNELDGSVVCYQNVSPFQGVQFDNPLKSAPPFFMGKFLPGVGGGIREVGPYGNNGTTDEPEGGNGGGVGGGTPGDPLVGGGIVMTWASYDTADDPVDIDSGDLNDDGLFDIVTANDASGSVSVLLGAGGGTLSPASNFTLGDDYTEVESIALGDFDGDGDEDIVVITTNSLGLRVTITLRNTLVPEGSYGLVVENTEGLSGLDPYLVRSSDVDNDGDDDIIALTQSSSLVGDPVAGIAVSSITAEPCLGDFDDDGHVSGSDLAQLLGAWGTADRRYDLDGDLNVSGSDLAMLLGGWGPCSGEELPLD